jgi:phosphoadenosine phosphosulfate reductase
MLEFAERPLVTTSFGPFSAVILHAVTSIEKTTKVIWCDTGYNTEDTYRHAKKLMDMFDLNIEIFTPKYTTAYLDSTLGRPHIDNPKHHSFSEEVKLEPFKRAFEAHQPDVWFTNVRNGQTAHRDSLDILSITVEGAIKVSPFYYYDDAALSKYLDTFNLPAEFNYFDPVKALENRECGIHLRN